MNPFLRYLADKKKCAQTDRHTPMTTRPCGLLRAGKNRRWYRDTKVCGINSHNSGQAAQS